MLPASQTGTGRVAGQRAGGPARLHLALGSRPAPGAPVRTAAQVARPAPSRAGHLSPLVSTLVTASDAPAACVPGEDPVLTHSSWRATLAVKEALCVVSARVDPSRRVSPPRSACVEGDPVAEGVADHGRAFGRPGSHGAGGRGSREPSLKLRARGQQPRLTPFPLLPAPPLSQTDGFGR